MTKQELDSTSAELNDFMEFLRKYSYKFQQYMDENYPNEEPAHKAISRLMGFAHFERDNAYQSWKASSK